MYHRSNVPLFTGQQLLCESVILIVFYLINILCKLNDDTRSSFCPTVRRRQLKETCCWWASEKMAKKIKSKVCYCENVLKMPDIRHNNIIFQQNGATVHRWRHDTRLLNLHSHDALEFIERENCPPNSPDLNWRTSSYFLVWGALQQKFYSRKVRDVDHLKRISLNCQHQSSQDTMNTATD